MSVCRFRLIDSVVETRAQAAFGRLCSRCMWIAWLSRIEQRSWHDQVHEARLRLKELTGGVFDATGYFFRRRTCVHIVHCI